MKQMTRTAMLLLAFVFLAACALTVEQERQLGGEFSRQVSIKKRLANDPVVVNYVREMGSRLAGAAGAQPFNFTFNVIVDPDVNAFAGPGGYVYVNTGLLTKARSTAEVAGVMAHEISHVTLRHVSRSIARQQQAAGIGTIISGVTNKPALGQIAGTGVSIFNLRYDREAEAQADNNGLILMYRSGYDPRGMVSMFDLLLSQGGGSGGFLSSHPSTPQRLQTMKNEIARLPPRQGLIWNDGKLAPVQARIRGL